MVIVDYIFTGTIPTVVGLLTKITHLEIDHNKLNGNYSFKNCSFLTHLEHL